MFDLKKKKADHRMLDPVLETNRFWFISFGKYSK